MAESGGWGGDAPDLFVDFRSANQRGNVGQAGVFLVSESGAIGEFGLQATEFGDGAVESAFVDEVELGDGLNVFAGWAGDEQGLRLMFAGDAHVPGGVEDLAEQEALGLAVRAHVEVQAFEELVEFEDFFGMDGELRGVDSVLAWVEEKVCHGAFRMGAGGKVLRVFGGWVWR